MSPPTTKRKKSISLLISTLLLVVIVVAGAALIYAYLVGFIGNTARVPSSIQVTGFCASSSANGCGSSEYTVSITNIGGNQISGSLSLTFQDVSSNSPIMTTSCAVGTLGTGQVYTCDGNFNFLPNTNDLMTVTVVTPDGGSAVSETHVK
jgi:FlaG/FlaF family flagellin (archaellin)